MNSQGDIMVPMEDSDIGRLSQVHAMRVMSDAQGRTADAVESLRDGMAELKENIAIMRAHDYKALFQAAHEETMALRREWQDDCRRRDERTTTLLAESLEDRKALWVAFTDLNGKHQSLRDRVIPMFAMMASAAAVIVSIIITKVLK